VKSGGRVSILFRAVFLLLVATPVCRGAGISQPLANRTATGAWRSRRRAVRRQLGTGPSSTGSQASGTPRTSPLRAKIPWERSLLNGQYDYGIFTRQYQAIGRSEPESHAEPLRELQRQPPVVAELERELCQFGPTTTRTDGRPECPSPLSGGYVPLRPGRGQCELLVDTPLDRFRVGELGHLEVSATAYATNNDHEDYSVTLSALYSMDTRTVVGVNYQYAGTRTLIPASRTV
jgi:hypothetical protein